MENTPFSHLLFMGPARLDWRYMILYSMSIKQKLSLYMAFVIKDTKR